MTCASSVRDRTSSLRKMLRRWYSIVFGLRNSIVERVVAAHRAAAWKGATMQRLLGMRRPAATILVCAGLAALGVTAVAGGTTGGASTFDVVEKTTTVGFVDNAPADADSPGDVVTGASDLFDKRDKRIGTAHCAASAPTRVCGTAR